MSEFLARAVETELGEHPAGKNTPELAALCEVAVDALGEMYQKIATVQTKALKAQQKAMAISGSESGLSSSAIKSQQDLKVAGVMV
jgi:hypothetical protein